MKHKLPMYYGAAMALFKFAEKMRYAPTEGEKAMWKILREEPFSEYKFRRQHPVKTFIADFYSHRLQMVVEIDGGYHLDKHQKEYDDFRDEDMAAINIAVIRFTNESVIQKPESVSKRLLNEIDQLKMKKSLLLI